MHATRQAQQPACAQLLAQQLTDAQRKLFSTLQATFMWLHGAAFDAIEGDDGTLQFVMTLGPCTQRFRTLPEAEGFLHALDQLEAPRHEVARFVGSVEHAA